MKIITVLLIVISSVLSIGILSSPVLAVDCTSPNLSAKDAISCGECGAAGQTSCVAMPTTTLDNTIKTIINLLSIIVGIVAIIMIIIAGLRYITSGGEADKVKSAKNTLIYAVIGLIIVALAQTITHFVLTEANNPCSSNTSSGQCKT